MFSGVKQTLCLLPALPAFVQAVYYMCALNLESLRVRIQIARVFVHSIGMRLDNEDNEAEVELPDPAQVELQLGNAMHLLSKI